MYGMCVVWGEPFSQAAQSFMPELLYGTERSSEKLMILVATTGTCNLALGCFFVVKAGRDLKFISLSMTGCFSLVALLLLASLVSLLVSSTRGYGLPGR
ncbi:hypothetical protein POTOM_034812 [Populus tomentosa]|uniref:Uncharacterized protein n=1 Tax=Populus tomentosa TaxID=118781 RepID=A0A8X8CPU6_POPTO|nr:hypothetical protein POTOM_034812 [Populus tomentosa]